MSIHLSIILLYIQIVSTGEDEENAFNFNEENLESILSKIPSNTKVAVLSVVGAFRTGKVNHFEVNYAIICLLVYSLLFAFSCSHFF